MCELSEFVFILFAIFELFTLQIGEAELRQEIAHLQLELQTWLAEVATKWLSLMF
jgi:hypothetical protein